MRRWILLFISVWILFLAVPVFASIPYLINYQGKLTDSTGANVADGPYAITFSIYDVSSGGSALWSEVSAVTVTKGVFNHLLGSVTTLPSNLFSGSSDRWLGIKVGSDAEMTPRQRIASNAYTFETEGDFVKISGDVMTGTLNIGSGGDLIVDTTTLFADASTNRVGVGTASPENELHIGQGGSPILKIDGAVNIDGAGPKLRWTEVFASDYGIEAFLNGQSPDALIFRNIENDVVTLDSILVINRLSGNIGIGTGSPSRKLDVAGDIELTGDIIYATPKTGYISAASYASGRGLYSTSSFTYIGGIYNNGTSSDFYEVPLHLPDGVTLVEVSVYGFDLDASLQLSYSVGRQSLTSGGFSSIGSASSGVAFAGGGFTAAAAIASVVIDNSANSYVIQLSMPNNINIRYYNYRARFTYDNPGFVSQAGQAAPNVETSEPLPLNLQGGSVINSIEHSLQQNQEEITRREQLKKQELEKIQEQVPNPPGQAGRSEP